MTEQSPATELLAQTLLDELPRARRRMKILLAIAVVMMATLLGVGIYLMQTVGSQPGF